MADIILVIHVILAIGLICVVLLQRSEGGGLGIGGGGSGLMTGRGKINTMTRVTIGLAAAFMVTSIALSFLSGGSSRPSSIVDEIPTGITSGGSEEGGETGLPSVPLE